MRRQNRQKGSFIAEVPIVLWFLIFLLFFPLLDLMAVTIRTTFLFMAAHNAATSASRARSFSTSINGYPTANTLANNAAQQTVQYFGGVQIPTMETAIVVTNVSSKATSRYTSPLSTPADSIANTYQIEVKLNGVIDPLIPYNAGIFGNIPGLTQPINLTVTDRRYAENPQGLSV